MSDGEVVQPDVHRVSRPSMSPPHPCGGACVSVAVANCSIDVPLAGKAAKGERDQIYSWISDCQMAYEWRSAAFASSPWHLGAGMAPIPEWCKELERGQATKRPASPIGAPRPGPD